MILSGTEIIKQVKNGNIKISPFDEAQVTTNSYDVRLGGQILRYNSDIIDPKVKQDYTIFPIPSEGMILQKGDFCLASTKEKIGSDCFVPLLHAKSGTARRGLFVHITADLIDIGSYGNLTLQLYPTLPIKIYSGMLIAQVSFWQPLGEIKLYSGKYQGSYGPRASEIYRDFE